MATRPRERSAIGIIDLSEDVPANLLGDEAILRYLEECQNRYSEGKHEALFNALVLCAKFQAVVPEWAADAIIEGARALNSGECKDFNGRWCSILA